MLEQFEDVDLLWKEFLRAAKLFAESRDVYSSPSDASTYQIEKVANDVLHLKRIEAGSSETIGKQKFTTAIKRIKSQLPVIPKGGIYDHVIEETTIVMLLPMLDWSVDGKSIHVTNSNRLSFVNEIDEAKDDDVNGFRLQLSRIRRGQNKFRFNLFKVYGIQCVISKCNVEQVLHACHIFPHSVSGDNRVSNGILLRADLHELFDLNLIAIHPDTKRVHISKQLNNTDYRSFEGVDVKSLQGKCSINETALIERWNNFVQ